MISAFLRNPFFVGNGLIGFQKSLLVWTPAIYSLQVPPDSWGLWAFAPGSYKEVQTTLKNSAALKFTSCAGCNGLLTFFPILQNVIFPKLLGNP